MPTIPGFADLVVVGRGGFATVYRAHEPAFNRDVAIKVLDVADVSDEARFRFERECRAVGSLSGHPGIVTVFGAGSTAEGHPYIVMEYMPNGSLGSRIKLGQCLTPSEAVAVGVELLDAIGAAHEIGVVHRDIKPDNVLVSRYGRPQLGDFGISSVPGAYETRSGAAAATLAFAAPEALDGRKAAPAMDLYSLGATLATLMTGRSIFGRSGEEDSVVAYLNRIMHDAPPDLTAAGASPELNAVVHQALAKAPTDRYASAADFAQALSRVPEHTGQPLRLAPLDPPAPVRRTDATVRRDPSTGGNSGVTRADSAPRAATDAIPAEPVPAEPSRHTMYKGSSKESYAASPAVAERIAPAPAGRSRSRVYVVAAIVAAVVLAGAAGAFALTRGGGRATPPRVAALAAPSVSAQCAGLSCRLIATSHAGASYAWSFGDGQSQTGSSSVTHTYGAAGSYVARVRMTVGHRSVSSKATPITFTSFARTLQLTGGQLKVVVPGLVGQAPTPCVGEATLQQRAGALWAPIRQVALRAKPQTIPVGAGVYRLHVGASVVPEGICPEAASQPVTVTAPTPVVPKHATGGTSTSHPPVSSGGGPKAPKKYQPVKPR